MSPIGWSTLPLKKYADFNGRAPRAEYWWYALLLTLIAVALPSLETALGSVPFFGAFTLPNLTFTLAALIPSQAVQVRRLHDIDRSGYWALPFFMLQLAPLLMALMGKEDLGTGGGDVGPRLAYGILILLVAIFGLIVVVWSVREGNKGDNRFGPDPYARTDPAIA